MKLAVLASLAGATGLLFVEAAPAPSYDVDAVTSYTVYKCITHYGSYTTSNIPTSTYYSSMYFYDGTTTTQYPYTYTTTPAASTKYSTYPTTTYKTSTIYATIPTVTSTVTWWNTITLAPYVTTSISTAWVTTTSWSATVSTVSASAAFVPMASHVSILKGTPNILPSIFATPATTAMAQFLPCPTSGGSLDGNETLAENMGLDPAAAYPTWVRCGALVVIESTTTSTATGTGTYTTTAPTPIRTGTTTSTLTGTTYSTSYSGYTTVSTMITSTYSLRKTSTILTSTTSTYTTTSKYASSTHYAACGSNNLVWGIDNIEIPWPTNNGNWKTMLGFKSAYDCCVYGIKGGYGGSIFETYTGRCQLATYTGSVCSALTKTFQFYTGCPGSSSWVVSNGNCGSGTWTGKKASSEMLECPSSPAVVDGGEIFNVDAQKPIETISTWFTDPEAEHSEELKV